VIGIIFRSSFQAVEVTLAAIGGFSEMGPTNIALVKLFQADQALRKAQARLDDAQRNVRIQEGRVADLQQKTDASHTQLREQQASGGRLDLDMKTRDAHIEKLREQQRTATSPKVYQAFLVEINTEKVDRNKIEDEAIEVMAAVEKTQAELAALTAQLDVEKQKLASMQSQITDTVRKLQKEVEALRPARDSAAAALSGKALAAFERLADHDDGEAMSAIAKPDRRREEYLCTACNMDLVTDVYNKLHSRDDLVFCPSCRRILYIPDDLPPELAVKKPKESGKKERVASIRPPAASKEAWTEEEFLTRVERANSPALMEKQTAVLDVLHSSIPGLTHAFNGQGAVNPAYNVYAEGTSGHILRINADGRIFGFWNAFAESGLPEVGEYFRSVFEPFALDSARESEPISAEEKNLEKFDPGELIAAMRSLSEKLIERRATADTSA
jgi:predicted  nucleic acid-binding Zn-ribbon protein